MSAPSPSVPRWVQLLRPASHACGARDRDIASDCAARWHRDTSHVCAVLCYAEMPHDVVTHCCSDDDPSRSCSRSPSHPDSRPPRLTASGYDALPSTCDSPACSPGTMQEYGHFSLFRFPKYNIESLESQCLCSMNNALRKFKSPIGWADVWGLDF
jgi:hypothetical protein